MRSTLRYPAPLVIAVASAISFAACGGGAPPDPGAVPADLATTNSASGTSAEIDGRQIVVKTGTELPAAAETAEPGVPPATQPVALGSGDLWYAYGQALGGADEAEGFATYDELVQSADQVVVGTIRDVTIGRVIQVAPTAPSSRLQFANYEVAVERSTSGDESVVFELPIAVTSAELEKAVQSAITPVDSNGDGEIDDDELAAGYNEEAIAAAYEKHWDEAVRLTLEDIKSRVPSAPTIFLLREVKDFGTIRPVNGDSIIVDDNGRASTPWRDGSGEADFYPVAKELADISFERAAEIALDVGQ